MANLGSDFKMGFGVALGVFAAALVVGFLAGRFMK